MVYFVDTNVFLRAVLNDEAEKFEECRKFLEQVKLGKAIAVTSYVVMAEMVWTLARSYKATKKEIGKSIKSVVNLRNLRLEDNYDLERAIGWFEEGKAKFVDCLIASNEMVRNGERVIVSYDREFDKLGVVRKEPGEIIGG